MRGWLGIGGLALVLLLLLLIPAAPVAGQSSRSRVYLPLVLGRPPEDARWVRPGLARFGYGVNLADLGNIDHIRALGFGYVKAYLSWAQSEPQPGRYQWLTSPTQNDAKNLADAAERAGLRLLIRVDTPPAWAAPGSGNRPPTNPDDFGRFMGALAAYLRGRVLGYELWNEPNLSVEWGGQPPSPEGYAALLRAAYPRIKAADPQALVVTAGLASTGGDGGLTAMDDVEFLRRLYQAGAQPFFDVLGSHPYGFADPPDRRNPNQVTDFQRAADQRAVMVAFGDTQKPIWATEFGWLLSPAIEGHPEYVNDPLWSGRQWQIVTPDQQAQYLVAAYQYAYQNWPWMGLLFVFNLDYSTVPWYPPPEPMRFYSLLNADRTPRPAYLALRQMPKPLR